MERQKKTNLAIQELGLILNQQDDNDKYELTDLLCEILSYPTIEEAELHRRANRLGNFDLLAEQKRLLELLNSKNTEEIKLCPCCGNIVNQSEIAFVCPLQQIRLGVGVRLYFETLVYYIVIFLIAFFLYSLYAMITNINASKHELETITLVCSQDHSCPTAHLGLGTKLANYESFKSEIAVQSVLGFMYILFWGVVILKKYHSDRKLEAELKASWLSASDFTLMLSNYPLSELNPKNSEQTLTKVRQIFKDYEGQLKSRISFEVVKVSVAYPLYSSQQANQEHLSKIQQQIQQKRALFTKLVKQRQHSKTFQLSEQRRNEEYQQFYQLITNQQYEKSHKLPDLEEKNVIFVTLRYSRARELIEKHNKHKNSWWKIFEEANKKYELKIQGIKVEKAPEPDQIKWENIGFPKSLKICRKVLIYSFALLLIAITLALSIFLGGFQSDKPILISILISVLITLFNFAIEFIIILLSSLEREFQKSKEEASIGIKIAVSQIINCIGVPVILASLGTQAIYDEGGLVTNVFFIGLINMVLPVGRFMDPFNVILKLREKYYDDPMKRLVELKGQMDLNQIYTFYEFQLGYQYAYIIKTSYFTAFFLPLQPVIAIFAPIGLTLMFFCNKYRLLYRFKKPNFHSSSVNSMLAFILKCSFIAFAMGQLYFMNFQNYSANFNLIINWVSLAFSAIFVFFPLKYCRRFFEEHSTPGLDYNQQLLYLTSDYDRLNPITKADAIEEFKEFLEQYQKKCHLPLPQKSEMIRRSLISMSKIGSASIINFMRQKTKFHANLGSGLQTNDRLR